MNRIVRHDPGCMIHRSCLVIHPDGICPGPYGKCSCGADNEIRVTGGVNTLPLVSTCICGLKCPIHQTNNNHD